LSHADALPISLTALAETIIRCERCPRLRDHCLDISRKRKREFASHQYWGRPVPGFGDPRARFLIVGLAPGAHGSNRTGRVFTGDASGEWLYGALYQHGWANRPASQSRDDGMLLRDCYITAAARCAPPDNRPTRIELEQCRPYLEAELALLSSVRVVLVLGRIGWEHWLRAAGWWNRLEPRERPRFAHGQETLLPDGTVLISSFHPSRQNTNTGRLTAPMWSAVFERIKALLPGVPPPHVSRSDPPGLPQTALPAR
jgi:uracil-DNA glycosylase